jgi:hypothetical protein
MPNNSIGDRIFAAINLDFWSGFWSVVRNLHNLARSVLISKFNQNAPFHQVAIVAVPFIFHDAPRLGDSFPI